MTAIEYLHTSFEHDAEFVEGRIVERPAPVWDHSNLQGFLIEVLRPVGRQFGFRVLPEQRIQTHPDRFRVPDVAWLPRSPSGGMSSGRLRTSVLRFSPLRTEHSKPSKRSANTLPSASNLSGQSTPQRATVRFTARQACRRWKIASSPLTAFRSISPKLNPNQ